MFFQMVRSLGEQDLRSTGPVPYRDQDSGAPASVDGHPYGIGVRDQGAGQLVGVEFHRINDDGGEDGG
jgi:hypothetical protein